MAGASHQHAHHHGPHAATPGQATQAAVRDAADGRGCLTVRDAAAAVAARVAQDAVSLTAGAANASPIVPSAAGGQAYRTAPIRPPGPIAALLPLRI